MFTFPPFTRVQSPFNILLPLIATLAYLYILYDFFKSKEESPLTFKPLDDYPYPQETRKIIHIFIVIMAHIGFILAYRNDMYHMSNCYWIQLYVHNVVGIYLLYRYKAKALNKS